MSLLFAVNLVICKSPLTLPNNILEGVDVACAQHSPPLAALKENDI